MSNVSHPSIVLPVNVQLQTLLQPLNLKNMLHHTLYCTLTNIAQSQALSSLSIAPHSACLQVTSAVSQHLSNSSGQRVQQSVSRRDVTSSVNAFDCSTLAPQRLTQPANTRVCRPVHSVNASVQQVPTGNRSCSSVVSDPPKRSRRSREKPKAKSPSASANPDVLPRDRKRNRTTSQTNSRKQKSPDALPAQVSGTNRYKTELCRSFEESGICRYGEKCQFAHGRAELRSLSRHPKYKTELCRTFHSTAFCPYGQRCHFVHDEPRDDFLSPQSTDEDPLGNTHVQVRSRRETTQDFSEPSYSTNQSFCQEVETQELLAPSSLAVVATRSDDEGFAASCTPSTCSPVKSSYAINQLSWTKNASSVVSVSKSYSLSTSSDEDSGCPMYFSNSNNDLPHSYIADAVTRELDGATSCADDAEEQDQDQEPEVVVEEDDEDYGDAFAELGNAFQRLSLDRNNNVLDVNNNVSDVNVNVNNSVDESNYAVLPPGAEWTSYHHEVVHSPVRSRTHSQQDELETSVANEKRLPIFASLAGTLR